MWAEFRSNFFLKKKLKKKCSDSWTIFLCVEAKCVTMGCCFSLRKKNSDEAEVEVEVEGENKPMNIKSRKNMRMMSNCIREIQAPVSDLCGLQNIMASIPEDSSIYHYAKCMNTCGVLLADMIANMTLYYTLSSDLYETEKSLFALRTEIEVVFESLIDEHEDIRKFAENTVDLNYGDIKVTLEFGNDVPSGLVEADSTCVLKIFKSILENAIRFTLEGEIAVNVYTDPVGENERETMIHIVVVDSGVGVPKEAREAIFEPLTKAHAESIHGGVGMGLPVSKAMCEVLGGTLELSENNKSGSSFHACFPLSVRGWKPGGVCTRTKTLKRTTRQERNSIISTGSELSDEPCEMPQILLVEDVQLNRTIVSRMMIKDFNVTPSIAEDGLKAVKVCRAKKFDVILMDISMPNMGGIEATEEIKKNCPLNKETPVIALTGTLAGKMESACLKAGMVQCLPKPIKRLELVKYISANVQRKHRVWLASN